MDDLRKMVIGGIVLTTLFGLVFFCIYYPLTALCIIVSVAVMTGLLIVAYEIGDRIIH